MIVRSYIVEDRVQVDGRRSIIEAHEDEKGNIQHVFYMAEEKDDVEAVLSIRAAQMDEQSAQQAADVQVQAENEKLQAVELLKLSDDALAKILIIPVDQVDEKRDELEKKSEAATVDVSKIVVNP